MQSNHLSYVYDLGQLLSPCKQTLLPSSVPSCSHLCPDLAFNALFAKCLSSLCLHTDVHLKAGNSNVAVYNCHPCWFMSGIIAPELAVHTAEGQSNSARKVTARLSVLQSSKLRWGPSRRLQDASVDTISPYFIAFHSLERGLKIHARFAPSISSELELRYMQRFWKPCLCFCSLFRLGQCFPIPTEA